MARARAASVCFWPKEAVSRDLALLALPPHFVSDLLNGRQRILEHRARAELYFSANPR
jgi:hypothetical protein